MPTQKIRTLTLFCLMVFILSGCNSISVTEVDPNSTDNILDLLDPQIQTEEQAFANAESQLKAGKLDNALVYYMKTLRFNPKNINALERVGTIHSYHQHPDLAAAIYQNILDIDSQNVLANINLGLYFLDKGQNIKAKERLKAAVANENTETQDKIWEAHNGLGVIADLENNSTEAIIHYRAALAKQPSNQMLLNNLGYSYYLTGDENQAKVFFNQALVNDNHYDRAIHNLALIEIKHGNFSTANAYFNRIMPVYESYNNIGYLCLLTGQYDVAEEYLRRAINESPVYFPKAEENLKTLSKLNKPTIMLPQQVIETTTEAPVSTEVTPAKNTRKAHRHAAKLANKKHTSAKRKH